MIYGDWMGRWGQADPEREALVDAITGRRYTYGDMGRAVAGLAGWMASELGVGRGDRVACLSLNRAEYITLFFALGRLGAILVPLNFRLADAEFAYYLGDAAPKALFFDPGHAEVAARLQRDSRVEHWVCFGDENPLGPALASLDRELHGQAPPEIELGPDDPWLIIYTSGTTGDPKGVILTHGMITANATATNLGWDLRASDRTVLHAAMFYTAGWNVFTLPLFQCRACNILVESFDPGLILRLIAEEGVTVFFGVPTMYQMIAEHPDFAATDFSGVRFLVSGGAPLGSEVAETFQREKGQRIWEGYGLTEVGPNDFMANGKPGTLGTPTPLLDVRLVDLEGNPVPPGADGEIIMRGPQVCAGYWNKPRATAEAINNGWFHTGDLGRMDQDGHFSIVGRLKDMYISGGANIYPAEIERQAQLHPAVGEVAVIGVPDPKWGEVGKAVVELRPGASLTLEELTGFLEGKIGRFKLPRYMVTVPELPRTAASGKVQKFLLRQEHGGADNL